MANDLYKTGFEIDPDLNLGGFDLGDVYGIDLSGITDSKPSPVVQGEDGNMYLSNAYYTPSGWQIDPDFSTPVYYFHQPLELGDPREIYYDLDPDTGQVTQQGAWRTEEDIRGYWEADQGMGYFKEANPGLEFDTWFSFIKDTSELSAQGLTREENPDEFNFILQNYGFETSFQNDDGDMFQWNGSSFTKTFKVDDSVPIGDMIMSIGIGAMTAGVLGPAGMGLVGGGFAGGATTGVVGSALSQGIINGKIDPRTLVTAGVLGGLGGWFSEMTSATPGAYGGWVDSAGNQLGPGTQWFMEHTQTLANTLGISFNEAAGITQGIMEGTVSGQDLEGIALSAVGGFSNIKIQQYLTKTFGNGFDVENWFREGNSYIPTEALFPFVKRGIQAAIDGGMSELDLAKSIYGFFKAGGDLDFVLPGGVDFPSWISSLDIPNPCDQFPDMPYLCKSGPKVHGVDICSDEQLASGAHEVRIGNQDSWYCNLSGVGGSLSICSPEQLAEGGEEITEGDDPTAWYCRMPEITNPCGPNAQINAQGVCECLQDFIDYGNGEGCVPVPDVANPCPEGFIDNGDGKGCVPIPNINCGPNSALNAQGICECLEDFIDNGDGKGCVPIPNITNPCPEGFIDNGDGKGCVPIPNINCGPNSVLNAQGVCECLEDFIDYGNGQGCVPVPSLNCNKETPIENGKIVERMTTWGCKSFVECIEGFDIQGQTCVKIPDGTTICEEGFIDNGDGKGCVKIPDVSLPCEEGFIDNGDGKGCVKIPEIELPSVDVDIPMPTFSAPKAGAFNPGVVSGLSNQRTPVPGMISSPQVDYTKELNDLIARRLTKRGGNTGGNGGMLV